MLAKSANPDLKRLAATDLAGPAESEALRKLADGWVAAAGKQVDVYRPKILDRSLDL